MGIRLYKKLGWGLTGLECDEHGALTDPRVNAKALDQYPGNERPGYLEYLKGLRDKEGEQSDAWFDLALEVAMIEETLEKEGGLSWPITRESDNRDLLLIQPVGYSHWTRYGDAIDQNEENALYPGVYYRIVPMPYGIYPYEGLYMDSRDGRRLDATAKRLVDRLLEKQKGEDDPKYRKVADKLALTMGFDDAEHAKKYIAPIVPPDIRHVCSWLDLFTSPDVALQLRPMLYVYWS